MFGLIGNIAFLAILAFIVAALVWNFYPPIRARLRGWSTILETLIMLFLYWVGILGEGIQEAVTLGYVPEDFRSYTPYALLAYVILKRFQTTTPVGG